MVPNAHARRPDESSARTRNALIESGEKLFAASGPNLPSVSEITRLAGQRNKAALRYHIGDREDLLQAIVDKHQPGVDAEREALLDRLEAEGRTDPRSVARALVEPLAAKLADADGGPEYLVICSHLRREPARFRELVGRAPGIGRFVALCCPDDPDLEQQANLVRYRQLASFVVHGLADYAQDRQGVPPEAFVDSMVDAITAMVVDLRDCC